MKQWLVGISCAAAAVMVWAVWEEWQTPCLERTMAAKGIDGFVVNLPPADTDGDEKAEF